MRIFWFYKFGMLAALLVFSWTDQLIFGQSTIQFNRDIRPILSDNCFPCHGPDAKHRQADLRLDMREIAVDAGAIIAGDANKSELIARINSGDPKQIMPPPSVHKVLNDKQKQTLKVWIDQGAKYERHWSFAPLVRPAVPERRKGASAIDAFIDDRLSESQVMASPRAEPWRIIRRLYLDLIGLPPSPSELETWAQRVEREGVAPLVDHLLASQHFGERMAVPWLDVVRYTDTVGFHGDQNQNIFPYRDYVINAFNQNMPFDRFTIEQLAGDLLDNPTEQQLIATGFNRLNMMTREGGAQPEEYLAKYAADRVRTVGMTWLGATIGCAECHDHKFDPFTAKDFYSLAAYFADMRQWGVYSTYDYTPNPDLIGYSNDHPFPPEIEIVSPTLIEFQRRLVVQISQEVIKNLGANSKTENLESIRKWSEQMAAFLKLNPDGWIRPEFLGLDSDAERGSRVGNINMIYSNVVELAAASGPLEDAAEEKRRLISMKSRALRFRLPAGRVARVQLELLPNAFSKGRMVRHDAASVDVEIEMVLSRAADIRSKNKEDGVSPKSSTSAIPLKIYRAEADRFQSRYAGGQPVVGIDGIWRLGSRDLEGTASAVYWIDAPILAEDGDELRLTIRGDQLSAVRVSVSPIADISSKGSLPNVAMLESMGTGEIQLESNLGREVERAYFLSTRYDSRRDSILAAQILEYRRCRNGRTWTMVTAAREPTTTRILPRGNWQDKSGEVVLPSPPGFLAQVNTESRIPQTRLDLARWIVAPENPLTARVVVNRLWKQFFGAGICASVDDVGTQGEPPSHPELLDWLATEFIESGWNVKHLVRLMVSSQTYLRSARFRADLKDIDPSNRLLASQNPRRLEAEFVRDNALAIAGLIDLEIVGGPSCKPYQPPGYYVNLQFPDRDYVSDSALGQYRRGLYMHWQRTFLHPMIANFDGPSREECIGNRVVSNTPQQALTLLNDPSMVEAARVMSQRLLSVMDVADENRIRIAFQRAVSRDATVREQKELIEFLQTQREYYAKNNDAALQLLGIGVAPNLSLIKTSEYAAWTAVCRVILNLHETITRF